jgi:hypothetical protein
MQLGGDSLRRPAPADRTKYRCPECGSEKPPRVDERTCRAHCVACPHVGGVVGEFIPDGHYLRQLREANAPKGGR